MTRSNSEIDELAYCPSWHVTADDDGPIHGETTYCNVLYVFQRKPHEDPQANTWGVWYDLTPANANLGLPMRAIGLFRGTIAVRWTSFGSPALTDGPRIRDQYIGFLERLANEMATGAHWDAFNVAHYADVCLEQVRIECVRLFLNRSSLIALTTEERAMLASFIARLRD